MKHFSSSLIFYNMTASYFANFLLKTRNRIDTRNLSFNCEISDTKFTLSPSIEGQSFCHQFNINSVSNQLKSVRNRVSKCTYIHIKQRTMFDSKLLCILLVLICCKSVQLGPVSVQSGTTIIDDHSKHKNSDSFEVEAKKGASGGQQASGFNHENENKHTLAQDAGSYNHETNNHKQHQNGGQHFGEDFHRENGDSVAQFGRQGGHRKGHHKSGYQNSYHKEESENNSSFYDDKDDHGGHFVYDSRDGAYGSAAGNKNQGSYSDGSLLANGNAQRGRYNVGGNYDSARADKNGYGQKEYYDNRREQGKSNLGHAQGEAGRRVEEKYYEPQYATKYQPRKTITIYEDPRDYDRGYDYSTKFRQYPEYGTGYDSGAVHLDFRRDPLPYYPRQQPFDYYY